MPLSRRWCFLLSQLPASEQETDINALKCGREGNRELSDPSTSAVYVSEMSDFAVPQVPLTAQDCTCGRVVDRPIAAVMMPQSSVPAAMMPMRLHLSPRIPVKGEDNACAGSARLQSSMHEPASIFGIVPFNSMLKPAV